MGVFQMFHNFWVEQCPMFSNFQIMYYILDIITILTFLKLLFSVSSLIFGNNRRY